MSADFINLDFVNSNPTVKINILRRYVKKKVVIRSVTKDIPNHYK